MDDSLPLRPCCFLLLFLTAPLLSFATQAEEEVQYKLEHFSYAGPMAVLQLAQQNRPTLLTLLKSSPEITIFKKPKRFFIRLAGEIATTTAYLIRTDELLSSHLAYLQVEISTKK